ncbi:MAG: hypothetical protein ACK4K7_12140 [Allosphingosinicella sp.]|uniref:hypothetical protein n=1 Tax=Allosphingosinicella sp. TaxID=2823234 RepID=UPI0039350F7D
MSLRHAAASLIDSVRGRGTAGCPRRLLRATSPRRAESPLPAEPDALVIEPVYEPSVYGFDAGRR